VKTSSSSTSTLPPVRCWIFCSQPGRYLAISFLFTYYLLPPILYYAVYSVTLPTIPCFIRVAFLLSSACLPFLADGGATFPFFFLFSGNLVPFAPSLLLAIVEVAYRRLLLLYYLRPPFVYVSDTTSLKAEVLNPRHRLNIA